MYEDGIYLKDESNLYYDTLKFENFIIKHSKLLDVNIIKEEDISICAIGELICYKNPKYCSKKVLNKIIKSGKSKCELINELNSIGGKYLILISIKDEVIAIVDCFSLLGLYYGTLDGKKVFSSNPKLLFKVTGEKIKLNDNISNFLNYEIITKNEYPIYGYYWFDDRKNYYLITS